MPAPAKSCASDITDSVEEQLEADLNAVENFQKHLIFAPSFIMISWHHAPYDVNKQKPCNKLYYVDKQDRINEAKNCVNRKQKIFKLVGAVPAVKEFI